MGKSWQQLIADARRGDATDHVYTPADLERIVEDAQHARAAKFLLRQAQQEIGEALRATDPKARYSFARAMRASGEMDWSHATKEKAVSDRIARSCGVEPRMMNGFYAPVLKRDLTVATPSGGGYLVSSAVEARPGVPNAGDSFLPLCTVVSPIPPGTQQMGRFDALPAVTVLATESDAINEEAPTTSRALLSPSNAGVYIEQSRQWVLQSEMGAQACARLLQNALTNHIQVQICEGAGSGGEVLGLTADTTIPNVSGAALTWATTLGAMEPVEAAGGDAPLAWVVSSAAAEVMRARAGVAGGEAILDRSNRIGGYPAVVIGGTTSFGIFGRWKDLIVYEWLPIEISVNPFAQFQQAIIGVRGWVSFNAAPQVTQSFSTITSIT